ncbi:MAG: hypothetical protein ACW96N_08350, partial [Candidatus Thorarchaeota archaeon]
MRRNICPFPRIAYLVPYRRKRTMPTRRTTMPIANTSAKSIQMERVDTGAPRRKMVVKALVT